MSPDPSLSSDLRSYLDRKGWRPVSEGAFGSMWMNRAGNDEHMIGVPSALSRSTYEFGGVVERIAEFENRAVADVEKSILYFGFDVTQFRAANDFTIGDSISLTAGAAMTESARIMVRSSATTAQRARAEIRGNFSDTGDAYANAARMGHTEQGSYIIPVMIRVGSPTDRPAESQPFDGMDEHSLRMESPERRVTRTMSEAFSAVVDHIVEPARDPRESDILGLVAAGASREFVQAISRVVKHPDVAEFEARFSWALSQPASGNAIKSRSCPADAAPLLDRAAKLMGAAPQDRYEMLTGQIVEVRQEKGALFGSVSISTMRNSRATEVRITQPAPRLKAALDWWKAERTVSAQGRLERNSTGWHIRDPEFFGPLEELFSAEKKS